MNRGIAFFSTLLVLSITSVLVTLSIRDSSEIRQRIRLDKMLVQENISLKDSAQFISKKIFNQLNKLDKKAKESKIKSFLGAPLEIQNQLNYRSIFITFQTDEGKVNINEITELTMEEFFENFFDTLGIVDRGLLADLFIANIDLQNNDLSNLDLSGDILDFAKGPIENFHRFNQIIAKYYELTEDDIVNKIDWPSLIRFTGTGFNINYANEKTILALPASLSTSRKREIARHNKLYMNMDDLYEGVEITNENQDRISEAKQKLNSMHISYQTKSLHTTLAMDLISYKVEYRFLIDINTGKTTNISMLK